VRVGVNILGALRSANQLLVHHYLLYNVRIVCKDSRVDVFESSLRKPYDAAFQST
jgi:hypothetical protein